LCYLGLLSLGKNDFEAVEGFRSQRFAHQALGLRAVPSRYLFSPPLSHGGQGQADFTNTLST
jgi:hypothetical protein